MILQSLCLQLLQSSVEWRMAKNTVDVKGNAGLWFSPVRDKSGGALWAIKCFAYKHVDVWERKNIGDS